MQGIDVAAAISIGFKRYGGSVLSGRALSAER
jgi:hypothetical protein